VRGVRAWRVETRGDTNTLSNNADQRSPRSATVRDLPEHDRAVAGERRWTKVSETETETGDGAALYGAARLRSDAP
jgi:hypothetical protein